jgi:HK97 family phage major capsid protein
VTVEEILAALQAIVDGATADDGTERPLTDEEAARYQELEGQLTNVRQSAEIRSRHQAYLTPVRNDLHVHVAVAEQEAPEERAFEHYLRTGHAPSELAEFRAQSEGTNTAGGYLVPAGFRAKLIERMKQYGGIAEAAETFTTAEGNLINYPTVDDTANIGEIVAEGGTFAAGADLVFATRTISAYKYMAGGAGNLPLKVSWELLQDAAFDVSGFVARKLGERIARVQAVHWATGTGSGQPQGIVTPITATAPTIGTIAYADLLATVLALDPAYRAGAKWLMNDATFGSIMGLVDTTGRPLVNDQNQSISGTVGEPRLLGYPVVIDQAMPAKATAAKFLAFGNINEAYVIRRVKDVTLVTLNELYAANGQTGFMAWARADGAVQNPNAIVVRAGT